MKRNVPGVDALPPVSVELARVSPTVMAEAVGRETMVGVALFTVTLTIVVVPRRLLARLGVKVTLWLVVPVAGNVVGLVKAKVPETEPVPPVSVELARVCPKVRDEAVGAVVMEAIVGIRKIFASFAATEVLSVPLMLTSVSENNSLAV